MTADSSNPILAEFSKRAIGIGDGLPGECRCRPPQVGDLIKVGTDDEEHWFGEFPNVMASESCGDFEARQQQSELVSIFMV